MRVPLITEFHHILSTDISKGTCTMEVIFFFYVQRDNSESLCTNPGRPGD